MARYLEDDSLEGYRGERECTSHEARLVDLEDDQLTKRGRKGGAVIWYADDLTLSSSVLFKDRFTEFLDRFFWLCWLG